MCKSLFPVASGLFSALVLSGLLSFCKPTAEPQPVACTIPATIRSYVAPDSSRFTVLELADSTRTRLRPTGPIWQQFQSRIGKRVRVEYVFSKDPTSKDSTRIYRGPVQVTGRPISLTCIRYDSLVVK